jgi:hypothetical protein
MAASEIDLPSGHDLPQVASAAIGRSADEELVIFDSSGSGVQDVAAAWSACREARRHRTRRGVRPFRYSIRSIQKHILGMAAPPPSAAAKET